jgi:sec-independent protein translocase protein TatC
MLITFALSFQLPLVVMALVAIGIVERDSLKQSRRYIYFAMSIVAAAITPGDLITATVALMFPLIGLFELGIWLSRPPEATMPQGD